VYLFIIIIDIGASLPVSNLFSEGKKMESVKDKLKSREAENQLE
jgi:hypothetical protein